MSYDIGYTRHDTLRFAAAESDYALYLITAPTAAEAAKEFRQLIGPSYIPPKWAFGLAQSRFGYKSEADIREVAAQYKANGLPLDMLGLRYALLLYLYSEFMKAALEDAPYFRSLAFDYPADPDAREVEDQLLLGEGLMIAPIYTQNAHGRTVYLPEPMKLLRLRSSCDYDEEILPAGRHYLACGLDEVLLFLRPGHTVPVAQPAANTSLLDDTALTFWRLRRTVSLCPTGCTPMTASPPTLISPTTGVSSGNKKTGVAKLSPSPATRCSETPAAQHDEKLLTNASERVTLFAL